MGAEDARARCARSASCSRYLKEPEPPSGLRDLWDKFPVFKQRARHGAEGALVGAPCQEVVWEGKDVDLARLPVQTCWPGDAGPLITWGLTVTRGPAQEAPEPRHLPPAGDRAATSVIMRWLAHRGGALDFQDHSSQMPGSRFPVAVALGADPATMLAAVTPVPDTLSEYQFAGLLRGARTELVEMHRQRSAGAGDRRDRAGRRRSATRPPRKGRTATTPATTTRRSASRCSRSSASRMRRSPIYHSTYTGKPPDEPAMLGVALNEVFVPLLQKQFPEIVDFYLPPEGCSYRLAVVTHEEAVPRPREARDVRRVELPAAVHVHQVHHRVRRRHRRARLEGSGLGDHARASTRRATR